ncbi:MAG TPA: hypothetical protein P5077_13465 [bacterium]|nr:hypothetical protein [bacterium]
MKRRTIIGGGLAAPVVLFLILAMFACKQETVKNDADVVIADDDTPHMESDIVPESDEVPDLDIGGPDPQCEGWRRRGNLLWWEEPFCCSTYEEAIYFCPKESRLPFMRELRTLVKEGCDATVLGGSCGIGGSATSTPESWRERWNESCRGCEKKEDGSYSIFGDRTWFWTRTNTSEESLTYWGIDFGYASIGRYFATAPTGSVRCVTEVAGAQSWQASCPEDTRDDVVELAEYPDYDYVPCAEREEEVLHNKAQLGEPWDYDLLTGITYLKGMLDVQSDSIGDKDFTKLTGLRCIDGDMRIWYTDELESLYGLESLIRIGGNLEFRENSSLVDITALSNLTEIPGDLIVYSDIPSLEGLQNVKTISGIHIWLNSSLKSLEGLRGLESAKYLAIDTSGSLGPLEDLSGLENLKMLPCGIGIIANKKIKTLYGLSGLIAVGEGCSETAVFNITGNSQLLSLEGASKLETITGTLKVISNPLLTDMRGLEKITEINGDVIVDDNDSLETLSGIENLSAIRGNLRITGNLNLADITALYNLESFGSDLGKDLVIMYSPKLPTCQCEHLRSLLMAKGWNGFYDFTGTDGAASCE